jgi:hypothetical protein
VRKVATTSREWLLLSRAQAVTMGPARCPYADGLFPQRCAEPTTLVKTFAIPRKGRPSIARQTHERQPRFRSLVKWRTGCEGRISHLKYRYDLDRVGPVVA